MASPNSIAKVDKLPTPTGRELQILKVLWSAGPSSVRTVHEQLAPETKVELAYNTVQTLLRLMEVKKLVSHHVEGRTFMYTPKFSRVQSTRRFISRVFDGAVPPLFLTLLQNEKITAEEITQMRKMLDDLESSGSNDLT
jgi:BlaI family transcriptional regulator, penicillinase repressor